MEGMLFGGVAKPPQLGARLKTYDETAASDVDGVVGVVRGPKDSVGVIAQTPMALEAGLKALDAQWTPLTPAELEIVQTELDVDAARDQKLMDHKPISRGDVDAAERSAAQILDLRYDSPMAAHAAMEPRAGVASYDAATGELQVFTGSQDPWFMRQATSNATGVSETQVVVTNLRIGGAFGGRVLCQPSLEAAWLAHAVGKPVKVQWSREDDFRHNYVGPQFSTRIRASLDQNGNIVSWHHQMVGAPILTSSMLIPPYLHWAANIPADPGTVRGLETPYNFPNHEVVFGDVRLPMPTGPWRGLGAAPNTYAVECAIDELARAANINPIEFRVRHSAHSRLADVLTRLQAKLGSDAGQYGVAATAYKGVTFVAVAAKVERVNGALRVTDLVCTHDCGRVIAPDRVLAQIEGNLAWGVSMALDERFELSNGIARTDNFDTYPIARNSDVPDMDIEMIDSELSPSGAAEAALAPTAAAIANGLFAATGERLRTLPLRRA
jgi:CO/xanthine dehydrogenase Mo-binding subunit